MKTLPLKYFIYAVIAVSIIAACSKIPPPTTAEEIIARSVKVHGGDRLTNWNSLTIKGTVIMNDGNLYRAAYLVFAEKPGKLRIEQDMTADMGRIFYEFFMNNGTAWARRNLQPTRNSVQQMKIYRNQLDGIAFYANNAETLILKDDSVFEWMETENDKAPDYQVAGSRPAYVIGAVIGADTTDLYIDMDNFRFLQETYWRTTRKFGEFKKFDGVLLPTKILQVTRGRRGDSITPFTYREVKYNASINPELFTEDMPEIAKKQ